MKQKALIVEDNAFMAKVLSDMLRQQSIADILLLGLAYSGKEALSMIASEKPDVVFLDIELPDMNGFEILSKLPEINFKTIFTTAHSHYAIKAFRFNALDYLVKPIKEEELREAIRRFNETSENKMRIRNALANMETTSLENQNLILPTQGRTLRFSLKQIIFIEGERNYSYIHLTNGKKELSSKNLAYFEQTLVDKGFFRCHRSYLVNKSHIIGIHPNGFSLKSGIKLPISRRRKVEANAWYFNMQQQ